MAVCFSEMSKRYVKTWKESWSNNKMARMLARETIFIFTQKHFKADFSVIVHKLLSIYENQFSTITVYREL